MSKKPIQIFLNADFHGLFKGVAARQGKPMADVIKELMYNFVVENESPVIMGMPYDDAIKHPKP